ncbi:MAG TPA: hypothetical protein P5349_00005 [Tenuifilaceae bacterium]|nr:hypothetical protein [Tenuifilaceae bacterium]
MRHTLVFIFTMLTLSVFAQVDSNYLSIKLKGSAFFDNKEFTGNIKKGYTHPGFGFNPYVEYGAGSFKFNVGFYTLYLAGADSVERLVPTFSIETKLSEQFTMRVGTLDADSCHALPEPIFKPERDYLNHPETGFQIIYKGTKTNGEAWINWEKYIKPASKFQEQFTVGINHHYWQNGIGVEKGFNVNTIALATHQGGQIDSTDLPVTTIVNLGERVSYGFLIAHHTNLKFSVSGYYSADKSPNPHLKYKEGGAVHPQVSVLWPATKLALGYWFSNKFVNPRGEELFGSVSTLGSTFDENTRKLITAEITFFKGTTKNFSFSAGFNGYYDLNNSNFEYSYTFRMKFDGGLMKIR